jgi:hypothetical protein
MTPKHSICFTLQLIPAVPVPNGNKVAGAARKTRTTSSTQNRRVHQTRKPVPQNKLQPDCVAEKHCI